jgi:hypothetical protein
MTDPTIRRQRELEARQRRERDQQAEREAQRRQALSRPRQREDKRLATIEREWGQFKAAAAQEAQRLQRQASWRELDELAAGLNRMINPPLPQPAPPSAEPYEGSPYLGSPDFNPALLKSPGAGWR